MKIESAVGGVFYLMIDFALGIGIGGARFRIEGKATLEMNGSTFLIDPGGAPEGMAPALPLARDAISSAEVDAVGTLLIRFTSGAELRVEPGEKYEAWNYTGPGNLLIVSMPGGELATFPAYDDPGHA